MKKRTVLGHTALAARPTKQAAAVAGLVVALPVGALLWLIEALLL